MRGLKKFVEKLFRRSAVKIVNSIESQASKDNLEVRLFETKNLKQFKDGRY